MIRNVAREIAMHLSFELSFTDLSAEELGALTADITDLTDSKGTTVNPHEVMGIPRAPR